MSTSDLRSDSLTRMFQHMAWADTRTLSSLREMREAPSQALDLMAHVLTAEHIWLRRITGGMTAYRVFQSLALNECDQLATRNHAGFADVLASDDRARVVSYTTSAGHAQQTLLDDILVHVSHHGMYHRGQVALLVRAAGGSPVPTDFILFARDAPLSKS